MEKESIFLDGRREGTALPDRSGERGPQQRRHQGSRDPRHRLLGGYDRHVLYVFPSVTEIKDRFTRDELINSTGKISLYIWDYDLRQAPSKAAKGERRAATPPAATGLSVLEPFVFRSTTYISMRSLYELVPGSDPAGDLARIHVITKYREGKLAGGTKDRVPQPGQTEDVCYYKVRTKKFVPGGE